MYRSSRPGVSPIRRARGLAALAAAAGLVLAGAAGTNAADAAPPPSTLVLRVPDTMTGVVYDAGPSGSFTYIESSLYLQAAEKVELWSHRANYTSPVLTTMTRGSQTTTLPANATTSLAGLSDFLHVTLRNEAGDTVYSKAATVCLNDYQPVRTEPGAAAHSHYPAACGDNPFALGSVQGIARGWASHVDPFGGFYKYNDLQLTVGTYQARFSIDPKWRALLGISFADATGTSTLEITDGGRGKSAQPSGSPTVPDTAAPTGTRLATAPTDGPRPDLAALPAWGMSVAHTQRGDYLRFAATVWNAGTSPLVVDGFRQGNADVMDAYQYFYDSNGHQTGYVRAGSMEWDPRPSHNHWHFEDFAQYSLLSADQQTAVVSEKEAFCLANTDAIDYTVPGANWHPDNTDLTTACGDHSSIAVSEVLAAGSGDTYSQYRAGQSFPLDGLANGVYFVKVQANPAGTLTELSSDNNVALRKVRISGTEGHRRVHVYPVGDITA